MTEALLIQALTGLFSAGIGSFTSYKLLEWRIGKVEKDLDSNEEEHKKFRTMDQHTECKNQTCSKIGEVKGIVLSHGTTLNQIKACINKHVDGCREIE